MLSVVQPVVLRPRSAASARSGRCSRWARSSASASVLLLHLPRGSVLSHLSVGAVLAEQARAEGRAIGVSAALGAVALSRHRTSDPAPARELKGPQAARLRRSQRRVLRRAGAGARAASASELAGCDSSASSCWRTATSSSISFSAALRPCRCAAVGGEVHQAHGASGTSAGAPGRWGRSRAWVVAAWPPPGWRPGRPPGSPAQQPGGHAHVEDETPVGARSRAPVTTRSPTPPSTWGRGARRWRAGARGGTTPARLRTRGAAGRAPRVVVDRLSRPAGW